MEEMKNLVPFKYKDVIPNGKIIDILNSEPNGTQIEICEESYPLEEMYLWVLVLNDDYLNIGYGKCYKPIFNCCLIYKPNDLDLIRKIESRMKWAKCNFLEEIEMVHMFYHYG